MKELWSNKIASFSKKMLTVNMVSCAWATWAVISGLVFLSFIFSKVIGSLLDNGLDAVLSLGEDFRRLCRDDGLFVAALLLEMLFAGVLALGLIFFKVLYFFLDKIQGTLDSE